MKIEEVRNAIKLCSFEKGTDINGRFKNIIKYEDGINDEIKKNITTRIYLLVIDNIIYKIGASQDKGGIKGTLAIYQTGGYGGRPSIRSLGIYSLIKEKLELGKNVYCYLILQDRQLNKIKGLNKIYEIESNISPQDAERKCLEDYNEHMQIKDPQPYIHYPEWNFQEANKAWPQWIKEEHAKMTSDSTTNNNNNNY